MVPHRRHGVRRRGRLPVPVGAPRRHHQSWRGEILPLGGRSSGRDPPRGAGRGGGRSPRCGDGEPSRRRGRRPGAVDHRAAAGVLQRAHRQLQDPRAAGDGGRDPVQRLRQGGPQGAAILVGSGRRTEGQGGGGLMTSDGGTPPARRSTGGLSDDAALRIFRTMCTIRSAEDRIVLGLNSGEFRMTYYGVRGQEVIPAAICEHLRRDDYMVTTYRGMHDCIAKGIPLDELVAEMCGKVTGTSKGKGGPMHLSDPQSGLMVTTGVVGAGLPIAAGLGLAAKLRGTDQVTVVNFGDGATSIGAAHEAANIAALWELPVIFVCQNNGYGEHTAFSDYTRTTSLADRFRNYGMASVAVDGNSVPELYEAMGEAVERARSGGGP